MNAKLLFTATLGLALVSTWVMADDAGATGARSSPPRAEAGAEPARAARAEAGVRRGDAEATPALPAWASTAKWRVREEARAAVRRGGRHEADDGRF